MQAWESFVEAQTAELGSETVQKWLKTLKVLRFDACNLYLEAADAFQALWFEEHIRQKAHSRLLNNNKKRIKVHLSIVNQPTKEKKTAAKGKPVQEPPRPIFTLPLDELDPHCTFQHYVVTDANQLTHKVFAQLADSGSDIQKKTLPIYNPIYVHGNTGSGKTHLLMAVAHALRQQGINAMYARAQSFTDHVVAAIRAGEMSLFRQTYRSSEVLILDDVHVFSRKSATQEEFFHTFNTLHIAGKQIILAANCAPGELQYIEPRLVSRFEWGIVLSLEPASRDEAAKIVEAKCEAMQFPIQAKVLEFLLDSFATAKSINKALEALILRLHMNQNIGKGGQLTAAMARHLLGDLLLEEEKAALTPERIVQNVAEFFGIKPDDILGKAQTRDCVLPRQISMHLCRMQLKMPFVKIGDLFGKDHSTVMSSVKLIQKGIDADDQEIALSYRPILKKMSLGSAQ